MVMARWYVVLLDIEGAFLNGRFQRDEVLFMKVPEGFEKFYPREVLLRLLRTIYGLKQAAMQFWSKMCQAFAFMWYNRNEADLCMYYKWIDDQMVVWLTWVDDCMITGPKEQVLEAKQQMMDIFECEDIGKLKKYASCKVEHDRTNRELKLM